jgi:CubicO group peptidase (beta-lactamase class C family)
MRNMPFLKVIFACYFFVTVTGCASEKADKIDKLMTYCYENGTFNGTICIAENRKIIYQKAFGFADFETGLKLQTDYAFYLGSVAKQFTTMAIMILKEQGKLSYEDPLAKYFPEFPNYADNVTIRNLMTHTSGVADHFSLGANRPNLTNNDVLELLVQQDSLNFKPGEKYSYSNGGFVLLSMIVAKASGAPFHVFMKENIFGPLGMTHSLVFDESKPDIDKRAVGYNMLGEKDDYNILTTGAGGIYSNLEDLYIWDQALYAPKLVDQATLDEAFQPFKLTNDSLSYYGYGWGISEDESGKRVSHSGGLAGYRTYIERDLGNKNTIILLTNHGDAFALGGIRIALRNILNNKEYQLPKIPIVITMNELLKTKELTEVINTYHFLKKNNEQKYDFGENQLNDLGYQLLAKKKTKEAIEIFKLNVEAYPNQFNPYDSLGEAYMLDGNKELAMRNYKKSLELNPNNSNAESKLKEINEKLK